MRPRQFTDEQLLETARRCFMEHGPKVSTATIAAELGVSQAALFKRIGTKEELLRRALSLGLYPGWIAAVEKGPDHRPVREQLSDLVEQLDTFFADLMPAIFTMKASGVCPAEVFGKTGMEPPPVRGHRALAAWFRRLHEEGRAHAPHPEVLASALIGAIHSRHDLRHFLGRDIFDAEIDYLEGLVETLWAGIAPRTEG